MCCVPYAQIELLLHPIHDQTNYLTSADLQALFHDTGVRPWSFIQRLGDAVGRLLRTITRPTLNLLLYACV